MDPGWQRQQVHRVTDTLVGARLDDHSEDQEVCVVENVLRQKELHVEATMTITARKMMTKLFQARRYDAHSPKHVVFGATRASKTVACDATVVGVMFTPYLACMEIAILRNRTIKT